MCSFIVRVYDSVNPIQHQGQRISILIVLFVALAARWPQPWMDNTNYISNSICWHKRQCDVYGHSTGDAFKHFRTVCATSSWCCSSLIACCACSQRSMCLYLFYYSMHLHFENTNDMEKAASTSFEPIEHTLRFRVAPNRYRWIESRIIYSENRLFNSNGLTCTPLFHDFNKCAPRTQTTDKYNVWWECIECSVLWNIKKLVKF